MGRPTTFSYAYLIAALLVAVTATSLALVSSVPLSRDELTPARAGRHVVAASWLSLVVVAAAAGVFALAGERVARWALGSAQRKEPMSLAYLRAERGLGFPLFSDPDGWLTETGLLLVDKHLAVKQRALADRADAEQILTFIRRGGARRPTLRERAGHLLLALAEAITPRRLAR